MIDRLEGILGRFLKLNELVSDPEVISDVPSWQK